MSIVPHVCGYCGSEYSSPLAAALCCDEVSNEIRSID